MVVKIEYDKKARYNPNYLIKSSLNTAISKGITVHETRYYKKQKI